MQAIFFNKVKAVKTIYADGWNLGRNRLWECSVSPCKRSVKIL